MDSQHSKWTSAGDGGILVRAPYSGTVIVTIEKHAGKFVVLFVRMMLQAIHAAVCKISLLYVFFLKKMDKINTDQEVWLFLHPSMFHLSKYSTYFNEIWYCHLH
jgi:hypothetical protein